MKLKSWAFSALLAAAVVLAPYCVAALNPMEDTIEPGWTVSGYGTAELRAIGDKLRIEATEGGALFEREGLDRHRAYKLKISGSPHFSVPELRLQLDDRPIESTLSPNEDFEVTITDAERLRVMVDANEEHYQYRVRLSLRECDDCVSDADLREVIAQALPNIESELQTNRLAAVHKLLLWTARKVDLGGDVPQFTDMTGVMKLLPASQIYDEIWKPDRGGASCGAFATFFSKILALFDVQSFVIDVGYLGSYLTHVTTVVPVRNGATFKFYIFDPTFGGTYLTRDGDYADLRLALMRPQSVVFSARPVVRTAIVGDADWRNFYRAIHQLRRDPSCRHMQGFRICERLAYDRKWLVRGWAPMLRRHGIPKKADLILTLLKREVISTSATGDTLQAFRAVLASSHT